MRKYLPQICIVLLSVGIMYLALGSLLLRPNGYMLNNDGDGLKNYFTPAYYLRYDGGLHFSGMNYPFGEHVVFTDNQPVISLLLSWLDELLPVWPQAVGIFNLLLFLSVPCCALLLYRIGRHYYLPKAYAVAVALLITFLSPQLYRFSGHYALAYLVFVPWLWWWLIRQSAAKSLLRWWLVWTAGVSLFGLIHVYFILMGVVMTLAYQLVDQLIYGVKPRWKNLLLATAPALLPLLLFKLFLALTDAVADRPASPYGFFTYKAYWESLFMPPSGPVRAFIDRLIPVREVPGESVAYAGFFSFLVLIFSLVRLVQWGIKKRFRKWIHPALPARLNVATWAGMLVFFFSMGIPFTWGLDWLLEVLGPLKQFRSLGRFAWVPYYLFSMYAAVYLYLLYRLLKRHKLGRLGAWVAGFVLLFWAWEAGMHVEDTLGYLGKQQHENLFTQPQIDYVEWLESEQLAPGDFQAILPIPAFFIGSEKFIPEFPHPDASRQGFQAAFQTGLPLACGMMSRTSLSQSLELIQLMSNELIEKQILKRYPSDKPLLLLAIKDVVLSVNEQALLKKAELISSRGNVQLMRLELDSLRSRRQEVLQAWARRRDSLYLQPSGLYTSQDSVAVYFDAFDRQPASVFGEETLKDDKGPLSIMDDTLAGVEAGRWMEWSLWVKADGKRDAFPVVIFRELDVHGKEVQRAELNPKFGMNIYGQWVRVQHQFKLQHPRHKINIYTSGIYPEVESLLIRPLDTEVFMPNAGGKELMYNNYYFP